MGVAIAAGKLMGFDKTMMTNAFGLAGYFAPIPCLMKYMHTANNGMQKFGAAGWTAKAGITAAQLAKLGEYGDYSLLDGEYGFWAMAGAPQCNFDFIVDASMSFPYAVSVVAHRIPIGPKWQLRETYTNPDIINFMDTKVSFESYDYANKKRDEELKVLSYINTRPSVVEVTARGQGFTRKGEFAKWLSDKTPETYASDEDLIKKFHANVADVMTKEQAGKAVETLMNLEKVGNIQDLIKVLTW